MRTRLFVCSRAIVFAGMAGISVITLLLLLVCVATDGYVRGAPLKTASVKAPVQTAKLAAPDTRQYLDGLTTKKRRFVTMLASAIEHQNHRILKQRQQLLDVFSRVVGGAGLNDADKATIAVIADEYDVDIKSSFDEATWTELFRRVDAIPPSLPLSQAAKESGWGTSRLARQNNNYFGERCFERGCGQVPPQRQAGTKHEIADFANVEESVQSYFRNINTHVAYDSLRKLRMQMRLQAKPLEGALLADGLHRYSTLGSSYIRDVKSLIRSNKLDQLDQALAISSDSRQRLSSAVAGNASAGNTAGHEIAVR